MNTKKDMAIIGIASGSGHDSGASLIIGDNIIAAAEEERFSRMKHDYRFPCKSIHHCLNVGQIKPKDVDLVVVAWNPYNHWHKRLKLLLHGKALSPTLLKRRLSFFKTLYFGTLNIGRQAQAIFPNARIKYIDHHLAHAASAYFASGFDHAAILTLDGRGEWSTGLTAKGVGGKIHKLKESYFPQSLGLMYLAFTNYLGFGLGDEYKVMGLAPYGRPRFLDQMKKIFRHDEDNIFRIDMSYVQHAVLSTKSAWGERYWSQRMENDFGPPRNEDEPIQQVHMDIAASLQQHLNVVGADIAQNLLDQTNEENLCLAGGVCLNGVMNNHIYKSTSCKNIFIQPAAGDTGASLGAALYGYHEILCHKKKLSFDHAYWGSSFTNEEIKKELEDYQFEAYYMKDTTKVVAKLLEEGNIIGWFQGRAEFGPRALGNRSIIADPRPAEHKDVVNARIKFREEFRPFAPSVLDSHAREWFDLDCDSPYMLLIPDVKEDKRSIIQAVTHVNNTARPQTVNREVNPKYFDLIQEFYKLTDCPVILNTSFNVKGEPIVDSPSDALRCFYSTGLDYLILGDYILSKNMNYDSIRAIEQGAKTI